MTSDPKRLQQILKNLLSNAVKFTTPWPCRRAGRLRHRGLERRSSGAEQGRAGDRLRRRGHGHRRRAGKAAADLRGLPAGRRRNEPQIRRHRASAWPSAANWPRCWAAKSAWPARTGTAAPSRSSCRCTTPARRRAKSRFLPATVDEPASALDSRPLPSLAKKIFRTIARTSVEGDLVVLIIEDDPHYARILLGLARDKGFKAIVATRGTRRVRAGPAIPAGRDHAGHLPARHAGLDGAEQSQTRILRRGTFRCRSSRSTRSGSIGSVPWGIFAI